MAAEDSSRQSGEGCRRRCVENSALVPFVDELVPDIDLEEGYLTLDPPGGLIPGL